MILSEQNYLSDYTRREALEEVLRKTEQKLDAQLNVSSSADQRAYAFCAVIFVVLAITVDSLTDDGPRLIELIVLAHFAIGAGLAAYSARPVRFYDSGASLDTFENYLSEQSIGYVHAALIDRNHANIQDNDVRIKRSARLFNLALLFAGTGMLILVCDALLTGFPMMNRG